MKIRKATPDDAEALLRIYAPYVTDTAITFEYEVPTLEDFRQRIIDFSSRFPYLVATSDDGSTILGYSYAHAFHVRAAFQYTVESTVYIDQTLKHHGVGHQLYEALEQALRAQGFKNMNASIAFVEEEDEYLTHASILFHQRMGFTQAAHFHKVGYKFGRWYDVVWMEKMIGKHE